MSHAFGMMIESLVAVLLLLTIGYCMLLNKRLKRLKADEQSLKATIAELITATEIAERAIGGLKHTVRDVNEHLGSQISAANHLSEQLKKQLAEGDNVLRRLSKIAVAARGAPSRSRRRRGAARFGGQGHRRRGPGVHRPQKVRRPRSMKSFRDIRVLPVVLVAIFGLAVLKIAGLVLDGGYVFDYQPEPSQAVLGAGEFRLSRRAGSRSRIRHHRIGAGEEGAGKQAEAPRRIATRPSRCPSRVAGVAVRTRHPGAAAGAPPGTGRARPRGRNPREPAEGRREADRVPGRGDEGGRGPHRHRQRSRNPKPTSPASRASSPCMRA